MRKLFQRVYICILLLVMVWCGSFLSDKKQLAQDLIRFHVVANSDDAEDQQQKLLVKDAVVNSLQQTMGQMPDSTQARQYLREHLPEIQELANQTLQMAGSTCSAAVSLCRETFDTRFYDTFSLPAGVYDALSRRKDGQDGLHSGKGKRKEDSLFQVQGLYGTGFRRQANLQV